MERKEFRPIESVSQIDFLILIHLNDKKIIYYFFSFFSDFGQKMTKNVLQIATFSVRNYAEKLFSHFSENPKMIGSKNIV